MASVGSLSVSSRGRRPARILAPLLWLFLAATSALVVVNALPYFTSDDDLPFLLEKGALRHGLLWRVAFHVHVAGGLLCLVSALPQFSRTVRRRAPRVHRVLGWTYMLAVLVLAAPAGLVLALSAKGGVAGRLGFVVLGVGLLHATWRGLERIRARDVRAHVAWMVRSYALAASALTFRVFHVALFELGVPRGYEIAVWLSFLVNVLAAEWIVRRTLHGVRP